MSMVPTVFDLTHHGFLISRDERLSQDGDGQRDRHQLPGRLRYVKKNE